MGLFNRGKKKGYEGKVVYREGLAVDQDGRGVSSQTDAWKKDADCGCGIDCCAGELKLRDQTTQVIMSTYFDNGGMFVRNNTTGVVYEVTLTPVES
jgi:hypothetical protein